MKKFKFQLETLLKVTKMKKDDAEVQFADASRKAVEAKDKLTVLLNDMQQGQRDYAALAKGRITLGTLMTYNSFFDWKRQQIEHQQQIILECRAARQQRLRELIGLMNKLKSIEQLKKRRFEQYKREAVLEEQKILDEIGLHLYVRDMA
jgi:flagellar FliJ protein